MRMLIKLVIFSAGVSISQLSNAADDKSNVNIDTCYPRSADTISANPISGVGHGAVLDTEGNEVDVTPGFILEAQRYYLRSLFHQADKKQRKKFRKELQRLKGRKCDQEVLAHVNSVLIAWLIRTIKPENVSGLASINTFLRDKFATLSDDGPRKILEQDRIPALSSATSLSGPAYINECRAAGVPIPPDWGSSQWQPKGTLDNEFISRGLEAEVFTFESTSPRGVCFALPRSSDNAIELLGIICQGSDTSKVCFWDNQINDVTVPIPKNAPKPLAQFAGGAELHRGKGGVCTDCHAGENPFIVHPGTPLDLNPTPKPNSWYDPLVHALWPQNPGPIVDDIVLGGGDNSCTVCHTQPTAGRFPELSRELPNYCGQVLRTAIIRTMPPANPGDSSYRTHADALLARCTKIKGELASANKTILQGNSPAESFTPCFGEDGECPRKKTLTFTLPEAAEVFVRYDLGQSHGCCADHKFGALRILLDGTEVHSDRIPFFNYGVRPISEFLEDFDYFFSDNVVEGHDRPFSQLDSTRVGPRLGNYKIVNRVSLGTLAAGSYTVELQVGDAGWNSTFEIFR